MKITKCIPMSVMLILTVYVGSVFAYSVNESEKVCKEPEFRTFKPEPVPGHVPEVDPETQVSFHVSNWTDTTTIGAEARKIPMKITSIVDKMNFFVVTANLPASLEGKYARIHIWARSKEGGCRGQSGWLLKIKPRHAVESESHESEKTNEP